MNGVSGHQEGRKASSQPGDGPAGEDKDGPGEQEAADASSATGQPDPQHRAEPVLAVLGGLAGVCAGDVDRGRLVWR